MMWTNVRFGDVVEMIRRPIAVEPDGLYPEVGIRSFGRGTFHKPAVLGAEITRDLFRICQGDLLINLTFAWEGAVAIATEADDGRFASHRFYSFRLKSDRALLPFLRTYFTTSAGLRRLQAISPGGAGRNRVLSLRKLLEETVPLPPVSEQRRIVARLDAAAAAITAHANRAEAVEAEIAATLAAAFTRITADAPRATMGEVAPLVRRPVIIEPDAAYPAVGARSFGRGLFAKPDVIGAEVTWQSLYRIETGDLVFSNIKAWEGAFAVAGAEHAGKHGSHRYLTCVPDPDRVTPAYLWYYLQSEDGMRSISEASPGSADRNRTLATKRLAAIDVPVPSLDAQRWFDKLQAKAQAARRAQADAAAELSALLPAMLNEAFE
jgi:type I restriction enzyme, S subunit